MADIYNINGYTDEELYAVLDLSNPTDRELEAKILHMIWKYENFGNSSGDRLVRFFNDIYARFFNIEGMENAEPTPTIEESTPAPAPAAAPPMPQAPAQTQEVVPAGTSYSSGKLNPVFRQTINRIVNIDSQYRNKSAITTDYTFNLSTPLRDVVSMKLNSVQIPYTWYTINANYGSNFLYLKGISPGVTGGSYDIKVQINPGNYTANELVTAVNSSFVALRTDPEYTDISFGITGITYDYPSSKSTINIDLRKVYNETDYTFDFGTWSTPNVGANTQYRGNTIPAFLGYNFPSYTPNIVRSRYDILPLIANSTADNAISQFTLTNTNNYFHIYNYTGTEYTTDPSNCTILDDIKITLSLATGLTYSRSQIISDLSGQLFTNTKLINSYINRYDYTESDNTGFIGYNKSYYEMYVELNRFNTKRVQGAKIAIVFSDDNISDIWYGATSALVFEKSSYELSNITSESKAPQASIVINSPLNNPSHIYLKCKIPRFNGRTDTGNVIPGGNTIANDFKININNSPAGGYTFNNYLKQINDQIFDASNNGNINTTNTLLSVEDSFTKVKVDINKRFRENAYKLDTTAASFIRTLGFTGDPDLSFNSISGTPYTSATYNIPQGATIMIIKPKTTGANKDINPYVVRNNTGQAILTTSISEVSTQIASICASHLDEYGDNVLSGTTLTFATQQNGLTVATLRVIVNKYLIEQFYDIQFVDPSANTISSRIVGCGIETDPSSNNIGVLAYSDNYGTTWSGTTTNIFSEKANAAGYNGNVWVAAGQGAGNTLAISTNNGASWTGLGKGIFSIEATGVAWNGSLWVATGQGGNTLARSIDGNIWTGLGNTTFTVKATGIAWNGNVFAATGEGGNTIAISQNGTDWTSRATSTLFSTRGTGIAWNEYIWVATGHGGNTIAYSKNIMGNIWTPAATTSLFSTGANGVVWNDSVPMWVAVGTGTGNTIATSYDGNTWTGQGKTTFTTAGYGVSLTGENPPRYIAAGEGGNTIVRSTNGTVWSTTSGTVTFTTGRGIGWDNKTVGRNQTVITDVSNSWIRNLKLYKSKYDLSEYRTNFSWAQISGVGLVSTDVITISSSTAMNTIKLTPVTTGVTTGTNDYSNGIILNIPDGVYTRDQLITAINNAFANTLTGVNAQNIASGSIAKVLTTPTGDEFIQIRLNINKVFASADYKIVFYDPFSFATVLTSGIINGGRNIGNTSWDSTLGWILGFHEETEYDLSTSKFVLTNGNIKSIIGDNVVSINIYSYFMILLDDFNNSHMNDGIVTTTKKETDVKLPGYTNRTNFNADPISGNLIATNISADGTPLTQKQVYAIQATLDQQTIQTSALKFTEGPFATNVFGLLPLNIANLPNNSIYVDSSIGLRDQQRSYFGPVNIQRMSVKLINDRGETVDLNGANWSFSFICEQLYQNNRA
jgi:hypothetical protein